MARYLLITYDFPPKNSPRAFRWGTITEYLAKQGHEIDVVTQADGEKYEYLPGVTIYPAQEFLLGRFRTAQSGGRLDLSKMAENDATIPQWKTKVKQGVLTIAKWGYHNIWRNLYWPDFAALWIPSALKTAKTLIKKNHYDALISVSLPFSGHVVGLRLKKTFPDLYWMADMGDPFSIMQATQTNNYKLYGNYNHRAEQDVFNLANVISVTTPETKNEYAPWLPPESFDKIKVMPPLYTPTSNEISIEKSADKFKLFYCGTLYKTIRNPSFLLQLFAKLADEKIHGKTLELHIMGDIHDTAECFEPYKNLLNKQIFLHGRQPKEAVQAMTAESNVLINICNDTFYQLPSKVVEYAATGKPVINFAKSDKDSSVNFFENYGNAKTINQAKGFEKALEDLSLFLKLPLNDLTPGQIEGFLEPYLAESVCKQYANSLPHEEESDAAAA